MKKTLVSTVAAAVMSVAAFATAASIPLPEHPRPDWERAQWLNLNGEWDFGFSAGAFDRKIVVPFGWGAPLSGVADEGDTGYYRRAITVPREWKGRRVFVVIGAADYETEGFLDGHSLGRNVGGYVPFEFELTNYIRWGERQELSFRIWDPPAEVAREGHYLYGKQGYGNARGIWQTVYLEARGAACYIETAHFTPHLATSSVTVEVTLDRPAAEATVATIELDRKKTKIAFAKGVRVVKTEIALASPKLWDLETPNLYDAIVRVGDDEVKTYFGFREIGVGKNPNGDSYVTLNGKPIYLQMCLDQSYHPTGFYTFPSDEFMKNEILISKKLALSGNRVHIKVEVPRKLYWADKLGVLIQADVPCAWGDASHEMFAEHWDCFTRMVARDFNHPSIYQWTLFNETWGLFSNRSLAVGLASGDGGTKRVYDTWTQEAVRNAYRKAKILDPTRIVEDNSPCCRDHVETDVNSWHCYAPGYRWEEVLANECAETFPGSQTNYIGGNKQHGEPMMNSECGNVWGYNGSTGDCDFTWDYHLMINAFRRHLKCAGWLYTEHHDVTNEWNGYVRFDRTWKETGFEELAGMTLADLHRPAALYFAGTRGRETGETLLAGVITKVPVGVSFVTDAYAGQTLTLERDGVAVGGAFPAKSWQCETLWTAEIPLPVTAAVGRVVFTLKADGREIARNFWCYSTVPPTATMPAPIAADWSLGATNVLGGLKYNGFGKGSFTFELDAPAEGGIFETELSAKRLYDKDVGARYVRSGIDDMLGGGTSSRSKNPNSYPQTSAADKFPATVKVYIDGVLAATQTLPDDPADHRGILSWLSQPQDKTLHEAGSYGWRVTAQVPAAAVKNGKVTVRLESDAGLAVYGPRFGRLPFGPRVIAPATLDGAPSSGAEVSGQIHWDFPRLGNCHEGMAFADGITGVLVWGGGDELRLTVGRADLWDHRGGYSWTVAQSYTNIVALWRAGEKDALLSLFKKQTPKGEPRNPYMLPLGRVVVKMPDAKLKAGELNVKTGIGTIALNDGRVLELAMSKESRTFAIRFPEGLDYSVSVVPSMDQPMARKALKPLGFAVPVKRADGFDWALPADSSVSLDFTKSGRELSVATRRGDAPKATTPAFAKVREESRAHWTRFWAEGARVHLPDAALQRVFDYGMYRFGAMTDAEGVPAGLQGPWLEDDRLVPWNGDYHFNINVQECYAPAFRGGHFANLKPLFDMILSWRPRLRENARKFCGVSEGYVLPHSVDDRGVCIGGFWTGTIDHAATAWMASYMFRYVKYSGDIAFLRTSAYDFMKGAMNVYLAMMEDENGTLSIPLGPSPEWGGSDFKTAIGRNPSFQLAACHRLAKDLTDAAKLLGETPDSRWADVEKRLPPFAVSGPSAGSGAWGSSVGKGIGIFEGVNLSESHRHHSHMAGIYPFDTIPRGKGKNRELLDATYANWALRGTGLWSGWSVPWASILHTDAGNAEAAVGMLRAWDAFYCDEGHGSHHNAVFDGFTNFRHGRSVMQMDGQCAAVAAILELLVHEVNGETKFFMGCPESWKDVSFENVALSDGRRVSGRRLNGVVTISD